MDFKSLRVLVTGGAGFIGSSLAEALLERQAAKVRILDDFSTGRRSNIKAFLNEIELVEGDLRDAEVVEKCVDGIDFVLHQGAIPSVPRSVEDPISTVDVNVGGTANLLAAAARAGVRRVVFASSSSVYGDSEVLPKIETMPLSTLSPYAASKGAGELLCRSFSESLGLETVCLRYFNVFGPRQDPNSAYAAVIPKFISEIQEGKPVPIFGDGLQTRDFTFVGNVIQANFLACFVPNASGGVCNIGCGGRYSLLELARSIADVLGKPLEVEHYPTRAGDVRHSMADVGRARELLGYTPEIGLHEGLRRTIAAFIG